YYALKLLTAVPRMRDDADRLAEGSPLLRHQRIGYVSPARIEEFLPAVFGNGFQNSQVPSSSIVFHKAHQARSKSPAAKNSKIPRKSPKMANMARVADPPSLKRIRQCERFVQLSR